uniref:Kinesin motor domain-containing protein n=1 Tax=Denticeps clupeoides TaxID=299321 RepID=A0AAY4D5V9_9TELE
PCFASLLLDKLQGVECPSRGQNLGSRCELCGTPLHHLRRLALQNVLQLPRYAPPSGQCTQDPPTRQKEETWLPVGASGGFRPSCLAKVTPLALHAQDYLEGVWTVSRVRSTDMLPIPGCPFRPAWERDSVVPSGCVAIPVRSWYNPAYFGFIRAAQKLNLSKRKKHHLPLIPSPPEPEEPVFYTGGFGGALQLSPPPVPPCLLRAGSKIKDNPGMGKVKVMVRICPSHGNHDTSESMSFLKVDSHKKQLTLLETPFNMHHASGQKRPPAAAPKMFTFDAIFPQDASQAEVCSGTVAEVIQSVVNGADGCIFCFGHANLGKTYTMIGKDSSSQSLGVAPCAIHWLFKLIEERKDKAGCRFSVRVSAVEICGRDEALQDLLSDASSGSSQGSMSPGVYLHEDPVSGSQLQNQAELHAWSAEKAAFYLDTALAARSTSRPDCEDEMRKNSHMLFTLHVHQYRTEKSAKGGISGGRSRLHLLDLGSCEVDVSQTRDGGGGQCLSLSALGNVILALANGAKHVPYRDSKLTMLLRESLGNINCRTTMIAHISDSPVCYAQTLTTVQLASRIQRMRQKKSKYASSSSGGESSCEEGPIRRPPHLRPFHPRTVALDPDMPLLLNSDPDYSSSSEHSCDTVIYVGPGGAHISDRELSDHEGPPAFVPIIPSLNKKRVKESPVSDGDHFKCNTFAELQERLECIDGSEGQSSFTGECKGSQAVSKHHSGTSKPPEESVKAFPHASASNHPLPLQTETEHSISQSALSLPQNSEPVVREKVYLNKGTLPKHDTVPSLPSSSRTESFISVGRTPPVGMSQHTLRQGEHKSLTSFERPPQTRRTLEMGQLRASLRGRCLERDLLRATVTLQQPVSLNGEDELVFTLVEELPVNLVPDNGRPSSIISFNSDCSLQALASGSRPVSIISSINDEYDAYTSEMLKLERNPETTRQSGEQVFAFHGSGQLSTSCWSSEMSVCTPYNGGSSKGLKCRSKTKRAGSTSSVLISQNIAKNTLGDSGIFFSDADSETASPCKHFQSSPETKSFLRGQKTGRTNTLNTLQPTHAHATLPRKAKPTSSVAPSTSCSRDLLKQECKPDDTLFQSSCGPVDPKLNEHGSLGKPFRNVQSVIPCRKPNGNSNSVPRPPKAQIYCTSQRVVDGCERSGSKKGESLTRMPQLKRGATTLGTVSVQHSSMESMLESEHLTASIQFSSLGKRNNGQKGSIPSKTESISPPAHQFQKPSLDLRVKIALSPGAIRSPSDAGRPLLPKSSASVEEFDAQFRTDFISLKTSSSKSTSSLKAQVGKGDGGRFVGSLVSLERSDSVISVESKPGHSRENSGTSLGNNGRFGRIVPKLGVPASTPSPVATSTSSASTGTNRLVQVKASIGSKAIGTNGNKTKSSSTNGSKTLSSFTKSLTSTSRNASLPPSGKTPTRSMVGANGKPGRGTIMGTKQAVRAANSRVSELASGSHKKHLKGSADQPESGSDGAVHPGKSSTPVALPSPYSKITAPRRPQQYSSGHGSDNSSVLSGELPPAMGRTALFYHSGGSSGYESMIRDSETTGSASSTHDSMSESGVSTSSRARASKSPKKRSNGLQRRRLIPAPLPDTSSLGRKAGATGQWVDLPPLGGALKEPFEIKVYEIDDVERLQRHKEGLTTEGLQYFNARLRMLEKRQQRIRELRAKHERLKGELEDAKSRLMLDPGKWMGEFEVDPDLDVESQDYLEALVQATGELEFCVNLCKSRVMMETCFDVVASTSTVQGGQQEVEV